MITCMDCRTVIKAGESHDCDLFTPAFFFGLVAVAVIIVARLALGWIAG